MYKVTLNFRYESYLIIILHHFTSGLKLSENVNEKTVEYLF